jgi:hypothetical protein
VAAREFGEGWLLSSGTVERALAKLGIDVMGSILMLLSMSFISFSSLCSVSAASMGESDVKSGTTTALSGGVMTVGVVLSCLTHGSGSSMGVSSESDANAPEVGLDLLSGSRAIIG